MIDNTSAADKSIVNELTFGAKTSKRVGWESWEFEIEGPHLVRVTNASYGFEKDDHSYLVGVEDRDGTLVPAECECPADQYNEEYSCKHRLACATVAGPVVLQAAVDYETPGVDPERTTPQTLESKLRADGGTIAEGTGDETPALDEVNHSACDCDDLDNGFPCANCYIEGRRPFP